MKRNHLVMVGMAAGGLLTGMLLSGASAQSVLLPLLLLACPLLMLFMGHGSGGHSHGDRQSSGRSREDTPDTRFAEVTAPATCVGPGRGRRPPAAAPRRTRPGSPLT